MTELSTIVMDRGLSVFGFQYICAQAATLGCIFYLFVYLLFGQSIMFLDSTNLIKVPNLLHAHVCSRFACFASFCSLSLQRCQWVIP